MRALIVAALLAQVISIDVDAKKLVVEARKLDIGDNRSQILEKVLELGPPTKEETFGIHHYLWWTTSESCWLLADYHDSGLDYTLVGCDLGLDENKQHIVSVLYSNSGAGKSGAWQKWDDTNAVRER